MTTIDEAFLAERERIRGHADLTNVLVSPHYHSGTVTWDGAMEITRSDFAFLKDAYEAVPALVAEVRRLRVKRCHYCDAPMREKELVRDGAVVGMQYRCSGGCP